MRSLGQSRFVKLIMGALFILLCAAALGLMFHHFSPIRYQASGTTGTVTGASVTFSLVFVVFALLFHFVCGLCALPGGMTGLTILSLLIVGGGLTGFFGYAYLLGPLESAYFLFIAPIVPLMESLFQLIPASRNTDLLFILLPAAVMLAKIAAFSAGLRLHARPDVLERSLRRIDRFYEYRRPIEEETLDSKSA